MNATRDHYISTTFLAIAVFLFTLKSNGGRGVWTTIGRDYSTWLYIIHPIFITCLGAVAHEIGVYEVYKYAAPIVVYIVSLVFLMMVNKVKRLSR